MPAKARSGVERSKEQRQIDRYIMDGVSQEFKSIPPFLVNVCLEFPSAIVLLNTITNPHNTNMKLNKYTNHRKFGYVGRHRYCMREFQDKLIASVEIILKMLCLLKGAN